jgi:chromosome segregation ATPase
MGELQYRRHQTSIDFLDSEMKLMSCVLSSIDDTIRSNQRVDYVEAADRANKRKMLIDKRDELGLVTEQFNRHEWVMTRGEMQLREREEEHKLLTLQLNDFQRQVHIMERKVPQMRAYDAEISDLLRQIKRERQDVDAITAKLEAPDLRERERAYCGRDFTLKELEEKVLMYEARINSKEQQLWEKQILLREVEEKIGQVTHEGGTDDPHTLKQFERSGALRAETMTLRRKKMAALAETAIYQAQGTELEEEKQAVKAEIAEASERADAGEAFDGYAAKIVKMHERDVGRRSPGRSRPGTNDSDDEEQMRPGRQHFDAYPTADGLSRPYGQFPVFQPAEPSGQLRHYRKETLRPIEL